MAPTRATTPKNAACMPAAGDAALVCAGLTEVSDAEGPPEPWSEPLLGVVGGGEVGLRDDEWISAKQAQGSAEQTYFDVKVAGRVSAVVDAVEEREPELCTGSWMVNCSDWARMVLRCSVSATRLTW